MKKIYLSFLLAGTLLTSCDMNELPAGTLNDETAIQSVADAQMFRNGIYGNIRSITNAAYIYYTEMQGDMFVGTQINGNRLGMMSLGTFLANNTDLDDLWVDTYYYIAATNYFLPKVEAILGDASLSESDRYTLIRFRGEAHWARAYYYYYLADKYCPAYNMCNPTDAATGVPLQKTYSPSGDYGSYPGRSTLAATFSFIEDELKLAYNDLSAYEKSGVSGATANLAPNASYLSTYAVLALQARIALLKGENGTAITKAEEVIAGPFSLTGINDYPYIWYNDKGSELIFVPFADQSQSGAVGSTGEAWINADTSKADYVATQNALSMYDATNDVRFDWFFVPQDLSVNGMSVTSPCFYKFPGNSSLNVGSTNALKNLPKPLRLSETYLILAEAAAAQGDEVKANAALNAIRDKRLYSHTTENFTGAALISEIRSERTKELIGEGFRISDLRRWGQGFTRSVAYDAEYAYVPQILVQAGMNLEYKPGDYRLLLPIPTGELETNPQLAGQQNPGF